MEKKDLHVYTKKSGGHFSTEELTKAARKNNIKEIAVTDLFEIGNALHMHEVKVIPAVEYICQHKSEEISIAGYFTEPFDYQVIEKTVQWKNDFLKQQESVKTAIITVCDSFSSEKQEDVPHLFRTRNHFLYELKKSGNFQKLEKYKQDKLLHSVKKVHSSILSPFHAIEEIKKANGTPVIINASFCESTDLICSLIEFGALGIETKNPFYTKQQEQYYQKLANAYHIIQTGGSASWLDIKNIGNGYLKCTAETVVAEKGNE